MTPVPLTSVDDVIKLEGHCKAILKKNGSIVGDTKEQPVNGSFVIPPLNITAIIDNLKPRLPADVIAREEQEYNEIIEASVKICMAEFGRDVNSRRAVVVNSGCVTYQHFYLRDNTLYHIVHMRGQDIRKFRSDFWLIFRIQQAILKASLPSEYVVKQVNLRWEVDSFHAYIKPEEVPL